jgi:hypothetical protein
MAMGKMKTKKLQECGKGTVIEITSDDGTQYVGQINDNDGESIEIFGTTYETVLDYSEIKNFKVLLTEMKPSIQELLKTLKKGTKVELVLGTGDSLTGVINDNDGESIEIVTDESKVVYDYDEIESCCLCETTPGAKTEMTLQEKLENYLNNGKYPNYWTQPVLDKADDSSLEKYLRDIQNWDYQQIFAPIFDKFMNGVHKADLKHQKAAVAQANKALDDDIYMACDPDVAWFVGNMALRVDEDATQIFLYGGLFYEAVCCINQSDGGQNWNQIASCSLRALMQKNCNHKQELYTLLTQAVIHSGDASLIPVAVQNLMTFDRVYLVEMLSFLAQAADMKSSGYDSQSPTEQANILAEAYPMGLTACQDKVSEGEIYEYDSKTGVGASEWWNQAQQLVDSFVFSQQLIKDSEVVVFLDSLYKRNLDSKPLGVLVETRNGVPMGIKKATDGETLKPETQTGEIYHLSWSNSTGKIRTEYQNDILFNFRDVDDKKLRNKLETLMSSTLNGEPQSVIFQFKKQTAVHIQATNQVLRIDSLETVCKKAGTIIADATNPNRFREATQLILSSINNPKKSNAADMGNCLCKLLEYSNAQYNQTKDYECLKQAYQCYVDLQNRYPQTPHGLRMLVSFAINFGDAELIQSSVKQLISIPEQSISVPSRIQDYMRAISSHQKEYQLTQNDVFLQRSVKYLNDFEIFLRRYPQEKKQYASNILNYKLLNAAYSGELDEAEKILHQAEEQGYVLSNQDEATQMLDELRKTQATELQELLTEAPSKVVTPETVQEMKKPPLKNEQSSSNNVSSVTSDGLYLYPVEEDIVPYEDTEGWESLHLTKNDVIQYALSIPGENRLPSMLLYLRSASMLNPEIEPTYHLVGLAVNDPLEHYTYDVVDITNKWEDITTEYSKLNQWAMAAVILQCLFRATKDSYYAIESLHGTVGLFRQTPELEAVYASVMSFVSVCHTPLIEAASSNIEDPQFREMQELIEEAKKLYEKYVITPPASDPSFKLMPATKRLAYSKDTLQVRLLYDIQECDPAKQDRAREDLIASKEQFFKTFMHSENRISNDKISNLIDEYTSIAAKENRWTVDKMSGGRRENLHQGLENIVSCINKWYQLYAQNSDSNPYRREDAMTLSKMLPALIQQLEDCEKVVSQNSSDDEDLQRGAGKFLLYYALHNLRQQIEGTWGQLNEKLFFSDFLRSDWILLDEAFQPDLTGTFCALPDFNLLERIRRHVESPNQQLDALDHLKNIFAQNSNNPNYGTAKLILRSLELQEQPVGLDSDGNAPWLQPEQYIRQTARQAHQAWVDFTQRYAMAVNRAQIMDNPLMLQNLKKIIAYWYQKCARELNYGFFMRLIKACREQIRISASRYESELDSRLDMMIAQKPEIFNAAQDVDSVIRGFIHEHNFITAEQYMNGLMQPNGARLVQFSPNTPDALVQLRKFWNDYTVNYTWVSDSTISLTDNLNRVAKIFSEGQILVDTWISGTSVSEMQIEHLLGILGWDNVCVKRNEEVSTNDFELFHVAYSGLWNIQHYVAAFGSETQGTLENSTAPMYVIVLRGTHTCDNLIGCFARLDNLNRCDRGSRLVLLDCALTMGDRYALAEKIKRKDAGFSGNYPYLVLDRVMLVYLAEHYSEESINRMLMSVGMPFSYYQPYVPDSAMPLPDEMFIGRKDELAKIKEPQGVNLVYGGRQLGKSALLKKSWVDINRMPNCCSVLVDLKTKRTCEEAALEVSSRLAEKDVQILSPSAITDDWNELANAIAERLSNDNLPKIEYLLILMDEADHFLKDCGYHQYDPISVLKQLQERFVKRFKFVLAGLHDVVRFHHNTALSGNSSIPQLPPMNVTPFSTEDGMKLLIQPLSYLGFSLPETQLINEILATTNNFPGLIQLYCKKLVESLRTADYAGYSSTRTPPYVITENHIRRILADADFVYEIRNKLSMTLRVDEEDDGGGYYYPIALLLALLQKEESADTSRPTDQGYSANQILREANTWNIGRICSLKVDQVNTLLEEMRALNVLRFCAAPNTYCFANKNFCDLLGTQDEILDKLSEYGE